MPRWRGEHLSPAQVREHDRGSSPLARGTPRGQLTIKYVERFIPAGAGNTPTAIKTRLAMTVHPRWRGEHLRRGHYLDLNCGSSPLARGTRCERRHGHSGPRFIPAGAGNTFRSIQRPPQHAVHPRWRGEHFNLQLQHCDDFGSSPLARGTRVMSTQQPVCWRFIPAGAGNTLSVTNCSKKEKLDTKNLPNFPC